MKAIRETRQSIPTDAPVPSRDRTPGPDLARLNEVRRATGQNLDEPKRGKPDANVNTPRRGPTVER